MPSFYTPTRQSSAADIGRLAMVKAHQELQSDEFRGLATLIHMVREPTLTTTSLTAINFHTAFTLVSYPTPCLTHFPHHWPSSDARRAPA